MLLFQSTSSSFHFVVENGERFVVGGPTYKKKNGIAHCTDPSLSLHIQTFRLLFSSAIHHRKLFYANELFQGVLIHVKAMCEVYYYGQTDRVKSFCLLDRHAYQQTLTLQEFTRRQFTQMDVTVEKLVKFIDQVAVLAADACQVRFFHVEAFTFHSYVF